MKNSTIAWTANTFNTHIGCTKISDGCDNCYAVNIDKRMGGNHWVESPRVMADSNWRKLPAWNRKAEEKGWIEITFLNSMSDFFDKNAPEDVRQRFYDIAKKTPHIFYLILTKRAVNIEKYLPDDWGDGYPNVGLGVTVDNIKQGLPRLKILQHIPAQFKFISCEPLLEDIGAIDLSGIDWSIVGGENTSKAKTRWMEEEWVINIQRQCKEQGITFFFKQWHKPKDFLLNGKIEHNFPKMLTHTYPKMLGLKPQHYG